MPIRVTDIVQRPKDIYIRTENLEWLVNQPLEMQYELFQNFIDLAKTHYNQFVKEEAQQIAGSKHDHGKPYSQWELIREAYE